MRLDHAEDLASFVEELKSETDRGLPLVGSALIDHKLFETLEAFFIKGKTAENLLAGGNAALGTFSSRTAACFALGLIDEFEYQEISLIRKIRNEFAHAKHGISFQTQKISGLCDGLRSDLPEGEDYPIAEPRFRLTNAIVSMALRLYYRPDWVEQERREAKSWVSGMRWRSIEEEKPPEGRPVMIMAKAKSTDRT